MKKYMIALLFCIFLTGCSSVGMKQIETEAVTEDKVEASSLPEESSSELKTGWNPEEFITLLEKFEPEHDFFDMSPERAASYGLPVQENYIFKGRMTEDGIGYVIGFQKEGENPFSDLSVYETEDHIEAESWNEPEQKFEPVFSFPLVRSLLQAGQYEIVYLQPNDLEEPEEIYTAFSYSNTMIYPYEKEEGILYLQDVLERGVRFAPPENGAYLAVTRIENGRHWWEYIPLSSKEEETLMLSSNGLVPPAWYGEYGIEFHVSQQVYEKTDQEMYAVSFPVLEIARERCRFRAYDISEIHDIVKARLCYEKPEDEKENTVLLTEELTDPKNLEKLETILASSEAYSEGKCPYCGILILTRADGEELTVSLAMDSCDGFILGSMGIYSPGKEKTKELWELFPKIREYSGWCLSDTEADREER